MRDPSIKDMDSVYTMLDGIDAVFQFRDHSAADSTIGDQVLSLIYTKFGDQSGRIGSVSVYTFNIGKEGKFLCIDRLCNSAGCIICVNVVGIKILEKNRLGIRSEGSLFPEGPGGSLD